MSRFTPPNAAGKLRTALKVAGCWRVSLVQPCLYILALAFVLAHQLLGQAGERVVLSLSEQQPLDGPQV